MGLPTNPLSLILSSEELLEAQSHVWNHIFNFINSMSLKCAIELGIPDIIHKHGKPMTLSQLLDALPFINKTKSHGVYRLMRVLVHSKFFVLVNDNSNNNKNKDTSDEDSCAAYWLTPASRLLLRDEPLSVAPFALAVLDPLLVGPSQLMSEWFRNSGDDFPTAFAATHGGVTFWESAGQVPRLNRFFNEGMASDARLVTSVLVNNDDCKQVFEGLKSMVDVGGGTGTVAKAIADAFPGLSCTVLDLPHVVAGLQGTHNLTFVSGDMFTFIPPADAIFLKWILHDWNDEECVKILEKCKHAIQSKENDGNGGAGKVIIVDMVIVENQKKMESTETQLCFDMLMMVLVTGRERTEKDWAKLFSAAGFTSYKITPLLGLRSLIEVFP